ncbi:negative elongation factor A-like [Mizuhopecten yessoensis]|uniref:Negative elongation factor A n=1 Tax=Mizuhopecten yessoensis TaxID=6573 RepID=A0A210PI12_MIZYE|nr:negative elongation factor A-like [Mizuhopecten yessoensis]OWF36113.1 Negative elongation factor A [Mizuhopecten yessoensis]
MATGDTALWLHNKLGSTDDLWSGKTICAQLSQQKLQSIHQCFHALQPHVKVKLMLSFLHIHRRNVEQWRMDMEEILLMAIHDSDQWVSMVGEILRPFPSTGSLNLDLIDNNATFTEILADLNKVVKKAASVRMLPMECQFLNKTAFTAVAGTQPAPVKHFALKRKPKSAILRAELLQKSSEVASNKKNNIPNSIPVKMRSFAKKMDDGTPLKGMPGRSASTPGFRSPSAGINRLNSSPMGGATPLSAHRPSSVRKEGGIKLLDLEALPVGAKEAKRRKKIADIEEMENKKKEKESGAASAATTTTTAAPYTPDYAAGLVSGPTTKIAVVSVGSTNSVTTTPTASYVPATTSKILNPSVTPFPAASLSTTTQLARENLQQQLQQLNKSTRPGGGTTDTPSYNSLEPAPVSDPTTPTTASTFTTVLTPTLVQPLPSTTTTPIQPSPVMPTPQPGQPKKGLSLTREQMLEAQEMFRTSNKVTRPEKALILGFMAGSRENPCPQQGSVLSIRLSENKEMVSQIDTTQKTMIADTFFQMNYQTGEWKRIKKYRECVE